MACNGNSDETCSTKSPEPDAAASLAMRWARSSRSSRSRAMARGVKPREMSFRSRVCCGASMLIMANRLSSRKSGARSGSNRGMTFFSLLEKSSLRRDTSLTSLCLVTTQKPPSWNPPVSRGCSFHQIGAALRNSASSATGSRLA